jgi:hypothetical protein
MITDRLQKNFAGQGRVLRSTTVFQQPIHIRVYPRLPFVALSLLAVSLSNPSNGRSRVHLRLKKVPGSISVLSAISVFKMIRKQGLTRSSYLEQNDSHAGWKRTSAQSPNGSSPGPRRGRAGKGSVEGSHADRAPGFY